MAVQVFDSRDARTKWRDIMDAAAAGAETVIERHGKPTAVVISFADYEALREELDDLRAGRRSQAALEAWQHDHSLGTPFAQVEAELRAEGLLE